MLAIVVVALLGQCSNPLVACRASGQSGVCQQQVAVQHVQQVQTPYVANLVVPYTDPFWTYVVGREEERKEELRLRKVEELKDEIRDLKQQLLECQQGKANPPKTGSTPLDEQVQAILSTHCANCHSGPSAKGNLSLVAEAYDVATRLSIANEVESGRMPPSPSPPLSDDEFKIIREWANADKNAVRNLLRQNRNIAVPAPPSPGSQSGVRPYRLHVPVELRSVMDEGHQGTSGEVRGIVDLRKESLP